MKSKLNIAILAFFAIISLFAQKSEPVRFPKPKQEPQKEWSKQRMDLYVDSILKYNNSHQDVFRKKVEDSEKIEKEKQRIAQQKIDDAKKTPDTSDFGKQYGLYVGESNESIKAKIKAKKQIDGMAQFSKDVEEADFIFQGVAYEILGEPNFNNNWIVDVHFKVFSVLKGKPFIGDTIIKSQIFRRNNIIHIGLFRNYLVKNRNTINSLSSGYYEHYKQDFSFSDRDSLFRFLKKYKGVNVDDYIDMKNFNGSTESLKNYLVEKNWTFKDYVNDCIEKYGVKKKAQQKSANARTEGTSNNLFTITDFYPKKIQGGVGERLTIIGLGFGASYSTAVGIRFKNADNGGEISSNDPELKYLKRVDLVDVSWSDTKIVVVFPSIVSAANGFDGNPAVPGSGTFLIASYVGQNMVSSVTSPLPLDVEYSINNVILPNGLKRRISLINNTEVCKKPNVYEFYVDATIKNTPVILNTVQKVLKDWSDVLKVDIKLAQDANGNVLTATGVTTNSDNKSVIYFTNTLTGDAIMETFPYFSVSGSNVAIINPDIAINSTVNWHFTTGDTKPIGKNDFYAALLHEVGHTLGVAHLIDEQTGDNDLMYWAEDISMPKLASQRVNLYSGRARGLLAAQRQITDSKVISWNTTTVSNIVNFAHPSDANGCQGSGLVKFKVDITTAAGMLFKWQRYVVNTSTWSNRDDTPGVYAGTTTPELSVIAPTSILGNTQFRCVITMPGGCVYYSNATKLQLFNTLTITTNNVSYTTASGCYAMMKYEVPCADRAGWEVYQYTYNGITTPINGAHYFTNPYYFSIANYPDNLRFYLRSVYVLCSSTVVGSGIALNRGYDYRPIVTTNYSLSGGNCSTKSITLLATSSENTFQWRFPNNSTIFGSNAGQNVPEQTGGTLNYLSFGYGAWVQFNKTPWRMSSNNDCFYTIADLIIPISCEWCSTVPSNLCSNNQRIESEENITYEFSENTKIYPNPTERIINIQSEEVMKNIVLIDAQGKVLLQSSPNATFEQIDLQQIFEGIYIIRIQTELGSIKSYKIQVNR